MKKLLLFIAFVALVSCTENQRARQFGGTETYKLGPNEVFVSATWKNDDMWVIVKDTVKNQYIMKEKSSFGAFQGQVIFEK